MKNKSRTLQLTVLGSGTSSGVPLIQCKCKICRSALSGYAKNQRTRSSVWIQKEGSHLLLDISPDFREQALQNKIPRIDAVWITHPHYDHIGGIDDLRSFNFHQKEIIPLYASEWTEQELKRRFHYLFFPGKIEGGGIARLELRRVPSHGEVYSFHSFKIVAIPYRHGSKETLGFRIDDVAYLPDCSYIPDTSLALLGGLSVLILDCIQIKPHQTHLNLDQALDWAKKISAKKTFLTHLGHDFDYRTFPKKLPKGISLAYDGLKIRA